MAHNLKVASFFCTLTVIFCLTGCKVLQTDQRPVTTTYNTPQNINLLKQEVTAYYNSGGYEQGLQEVANVAIEYLKSCKNTPGKLAIVLDIDETSLSNWKYEKDNDFSYSSESWLKWKLEAACPAIKPTLEVYNQAKKQNISIFFITGGSEKYREATISNLKKVGYTDYTKLIMEPADKHYHFAENFKAPERKKITEQGYRIILNMGDQYSDLEGGYADKTFKLPDPFYYVP